MVHGEREGGCVCVWGGGGRGGSPDRGLGIKVLEALGHADGQQHQRQLFLRRQKQTRHRQQPFPRQRPRPRVRVRVRVPPSSRYHSLLGLQARLAVHAALQLLVQDLRRLLGRLHPLLHLQRARGAQWSRLVLSLNERRTFISK